MELTRVIGAAVLGGTVSRIGGGKFANGAVTGAFHTIQGKNPANARELIYYGKSAGF